MARDGLEALALARSLKPDLILMDIRMPNCDGLKATRLIKAEMPEVKIVILTTSTDDQDLFETVRSGACGYLLKSMDAEELVEALHQVQAGIPPFSPGLAQKLLNEFAGRDKPKVEEEVHLVAHVGGEVALQDAARGARRRRSRSLGPGPCLVPGVCWWSPRIGVGTRPTPFPIWCGWSSR